jgi:entericidin B
MMKGLSQCGRPFFHPPASAQTMNANTAAKTAAKTLFLAVLLTGAAACNTVKGLGDDIKSVGEAGEKAID